MMRKSQQSLYYPLLSKRVLKRKPLDFSILFQAVVWFRMQGWEQRKIRREKIRCSQLTGSLTGYELLWRKPTKKS